MAEPVPVPVRRLISTVCLNVTDKVEEIATRTRETSASIKQIEDVTDQR